MDPRQIARMISEDADVFIENQAQERTKHLQDLRALISKLEAGGGGMPLSKRIRQVYGGLIDQAIDQGYAEIAPVRTLVLTARGRDLLGSKAARQQQAGRQQRGAPVGSSGMRYNAAKDQVVLYSPTEGNIATDISLDQLKKIYMGMRKTGKPQKIQRPNGEVLVLQPKVVRNFLARVIRGLSKIPTLTPAKTAEASESESSP